MGIGLWPIALVGVVVVLLAWLVITVSVGNPKVGHPRGHDHPHERGAVHGGVVTGDRGQTNSYGHYQE